MRIGFGARQRFNYVMVQRGLIYQDEAVYTYPEQDI